MKIIRIPNPLCKKIRARKRHIVLIDQELQAIHRAESRQSSLNSIKNITRFEAQPPVSKVRQIPTKSIELRLSSQEPLKSSPPGIIKTRAVLSTSFKKKQDLTYLTAKSPLSSPSPSKLSLPSPASPACPPCRTLSSSNYLTKIKFLLSNTRLPSSEEHKCLGKSRAELESASHNFRLNSYLRSLNPTLNNRL